MPIILDNFDARRMERLKSTIETNAAMVEAMQAFLSANPRYVAEKQIQQLVDEYDMSPGMAYSMLMSTALGFDTLKNQAHQQLFQDYILPAITEADAAKFSADPFISVIFSPMKKGDLELRMLNIQPYEAFAYDDCYTTSDFREYMRIGFLNSAIEYPAVIQGGNIVAAANPFTISTSQEAIEQARGRVLCLGLGIGYFAAMASLKKSVASITIMEPSQDLIDIFTGCIIARIGCPAKVEAICCNPLQFAQNQQNIMLYDFIFTDYCSIDLFLRLNGERCYFAREKKMLSKLRTALIRQLYKIYKMPESGDPAAAISISNYSEVAAMISDRQLRSLKATLI